MTHEEECAEVQRTIKGIAQKDARSLFERTLLAETPADDLPAIVEEQVGLFRGFLADNGAEVGDTATATDWYHRYLVSECARVARSSFFEEGHA